MSDFSKIRSQVELDLDRIAKLRSEFADAIRSADSVEVESERVVLLGTVLHSFYNGAENAIKRILIEIDKDSPGGDSSHTSLLKQAADSALHRPPVISAELHDALVMYMSFRHFFRHSYAFDLSW